MRAPTFPAWLLLVGLPGICIAQSTQQPRPPRPLVLFTDDPRPVVVMSRAQPRTQLEIPPSAAPTIDKETAVAIAKAQQRLEDIDGSMRELKKSVDDIGKDVAGLKETNHMFGSIGSFFAWLVPIGISVASLVIVVRKERRAKPAEQT